MDLTRAINKGLFDIILKHQDEIELRHLDLAESIGNLKIINFCKARLEYNHFIGSSLNIYEAQQSFSSYKYEE